MAPRHDRREYHAWNEVYLQNEGWVTVAIRVEKTKWSLLDSTLASSMKDEAMAKLIYDNKYTVNGVMKY